MINKILTYGNLKKMFIASLVLIYLADLLIPKHHIVVSWEALPGFYSIYGFLSCVLIVLVSKLLGIWLQKREEYYE
ncbi:MAG: hypothetical protein B6U97_00640 [Candidatus Altiarchaeales archaeon ex4484_96]|nr:MAG: hypothetical protein B6U97_00640 [Candidatus Altiarchaeales archaeon ex4484_96]